MGIMTPQRFLLVFGLGFFSIFALVGGILGYVFFLKEDSLDSPGIDQALSRARGDERVVAWLGEPLQKVRARGGVESASVNAKVDVVLGLRGPRGEADLMAVGFRLGQGPWEYSALELRQGERRIDLLSDVKAE
jgi:hypothetical protein